MIQYQSAAKLCIGCIISNLLMFHKLMLSYVIVDVILINIIVGSISEQVIVFTDYVKNILKYSLF